MPKLKTHAGLKSSGSKSPSDIPDWSLSFAVRAVILLIAGPLLLLLVAIFASLYSPPMTAFLREHFDSTVLYVLLAAYYVPFLVYMVFKLKQRPHVLSDLGFRRFSVWAAIRYIVTYPFVYLAVLLIGLLIITSVARVFGFELTPGDLAPAKDRSFNWALFVAAVTIAPIVEEALFRGILLQAFARKYGWLKGSIFSSGIFSLLHGPVAPLIMIFSLYLSRMFYKTRSIVPGMILHAINNATVSLLLLINL